MLILRKLFFYLFLLIYIIVCPLVILHALGITFKPETQSIQKTGIIYLSTIPPEAHVYINRHHFPERTPTIIRNLRPGRYTLRLALKDHIAWEKTLPVLAEKATSVNKILLLPAQLDIKQLSSFEARDLVPIEGQSIFLIKKGDLLEDLFVYQDAAITPLFGSNSTYLKGKLKDIFKVKQSPFILLRIFLKGTEKFLWIDLHSQPTVIEDLTGLFQGEPEQVAWDPQVPHTIFTFQNNTINRLDIKNQAVYPALAEKIQNFTVSQDHIYALTEDRIFQRMSYDGENVEILLEDPELREKIFGQMERPAIEILSREVFLFRDRKGKLLSNRLPYEFVKRGVEGFAYERNGKRLMVWTDRRIGVLDFGEKTTETIFEEAPALEWLAESHAGIGQGFWVNNGTHILYRDRNRIFIAESEEFPEPLSREIFRVRRNSSIVYRDELGQIFFLDPENGYLSSVQLLPPESLFPLPVEEKESEKEKEKEE
jgi:hypothetical protein